jgi:hypothetical protein
MGFNKLHFILLFVIFEIYKLQRNFHYFCKYKDGVKLVIIYIHT